jgi:8-oxo-dGTP pyrophosphatase MutT (NUDIX family)
VTEGAVSLARLVKDPSTIPFESAHDNLPTLDAALLCVSGVIEVFEKQFEWAPELTGDQFRLRPDGLRKAAVMLALVARDSSLGDASELDLLLTRRNPSLREHSGQIAFPGGRVDPTDASDEAAALREAYEEVGLNPVSVKVLGQLTRYVTGTGFDIAPVVGVVSQVFVPRLSHGEVSEVFQVPLSFIMDPRNHRRHVVDIPATATSGAGQRTFYSMLYQNYFIWGATAAMLRNFYRMLAASKA